MAEKGLMQYKASDGTEVKLTPATVTKYILTGDQNVSDKDVFGFMMKCQARHLNPLAGDAYMTCFKGKASVIVSKDYFLRTATQQPTFDGLKAGVVVANKHTGELAYREGSIVGAASETLVGGWAEVYDKGRRVPSRAEVSLAEYDQHRSMWRDPSQGGKPATMIRKVALVQALREAYPGAYGGLYDSAEMPGPDTDQQPPEPEAVAVERQEQTESNPQPKVEATAKAEPAKGNQAAVEPDLYETDQDF
jgi:phage recombination protein Bet